MGKPTIQGPPGTRDMYPRDLLRRRYIEKLWRDTSVRHGFDEIDGPTFEHSDLYAVKSGEGILGELFQAFSGKSPEEVRQVQESGRAPYALRPEFTPTLARMYAAREAQLPKPCKWFWQQSCYRAERPQRGRLREFGQWNVDMMGDGSPDSDAEVIGAAVEMLSAAGLTPSDVRVGYSHRRVLGDIVRALGVDDDHVPPAFVLLDRRDRLNNDDLEAMAFEFGVTSGDFVAFLRRPRQQESFEELVRWVPNLSGQAASGLALVLEGYKSAFDQAGIQEWCRLDLGIVRGLAYYTGLVFEIVADGERAVAGGGRYDQLIELFGGAPTPAVGFGMGDVVLSLLLEDKGLMPDGRDLLVALESTPAFMRPDAFVFANEDEAARERVVGLVASLRRGVESPAWRERATKKPWDHDRYEVRPLHARRSYKSTGNIGKLLKEAAGSHARFAVIVESADFATVKDLDSGTQEREVPLDQVARRLTTCP